MGVKRIDHIAIVVEDVDEALTVYRDVLGLPVQMISEEPAEKVKIAFMPMPEGNSEIELIEPTTDDSGVAKYLAKRGEGMHHVCVEVDDIESSVADLKAKNLDVLGEIRSNVRGDRYIFVHPKSSHGVLVELYEKGEGGGGH